MSKSQADYLKEIAEKINNGKRYEIDNPTIRDIKKLKDFDYIVSNGAYFPVTIRKRYYIEPFFGIPTVMWYNGYEIGDDVMGMIPETYTAEDVLEELQGFKGVEK